MEEIYNLLSERLSSINDLVRKSESIVSQLESNSSFSITPQQLSELSIFTNNLKKAEKIRILKENDYLEVVFSFRNFDSAQRLRFQTKSYEIMQTISADFSYDNYNASGEIKDISKLYLKFFQYLQLSARIEDLKRAYSNNKLINYPMVSILTKWLVEVSRKYYQEMLKEKSNLLYSKMSNSFNNSMVSARKSNNNEGVQKAVRSIKVSYSVEPLTDRTLEKNPSKTMQIKLRELDDEISKKNFPIITSAPVSNTNGSALAQKALTQFEVKQPLNSLEEAKKDPDKEIFALNPSYSHRSDSVEQLGVQKPKAITARQKVAELLAEESFPRLVAISIPEPSYGNYFDVIEDIDLTSLSYILPTSCFKPYMLKKVKGSKLLDFEKKKDLMVQLYKNLYSRNTDSDRTISNYKLKLRNKKKIQYDPLQAASRGDSYSETFSVPSLLRRFSHLISEQVKQIYPHIFNNRERTQVNLAAITQLKFRIKSNTKPKHRECRSLPPERVTDEAEGENSCSKTPAQGINSNQKNHQAATLKEDPSANEKNIPEEPREKVSTNAPDDHESENPFSDRLLNTQQPETYFVAISETSRNGQRDELSRRTSVVPNSLEKHFSTPDISRNISKSTDLQEQPQIVTAPCVRAKTETFYGTPLRAKSLQNREYLPHVNSSNNLIQIREDKGLLAEGMQVTFYQSKDTRENKFANTLREKERIHVPPLKFQEQLKEIALMKKLIADPNTNSFEAFKCGSIKSQQAKIAANTRKLVLSKSKNESPLIKMTLLSTNGSLKTIHNFF